jgi:hypothetical protein
MWNFMITVLYKWPKLGSFKEGKFYRKNVRDKRVNLAYRSENKHAVEGVTFDSSSLQCHFNPLKPSGYSLYTTCFNSQ